LGPEQQAQHLDRPQPPVELVGVDAGLVDGRHQGVERMLVVFEQRAPIIWV